jgi:hypothetical protein
LSEDSKPAIEFARGIPIDLVPLLAPLLLIDAIIDGRSNDAYAAVGLLTDARLIEGHRIRGDFKLIRTRRKYEI